MRIRVPASSANLGAGFDCFGIAWNMYNTIDFSLDTDGLRISGCEEEFCNESNLSYVAFKKTLDYAGRACPPVAISFGETQIPVSRGLGSSAALSAAGVIAADSLMGLNLADDEKLQIASLIEGHPDNVAPALFGGFTVSVTDGERAVSRNFPISDKLYFAAIIPPFRLSTALSRSVLPERPSRGDAVFNIGRAALFTKAIAEGDSKLIKVSMQDKIHQDYRFPWIDGWQEALAAAEKCGALACCLSGAGSTLLALSDNEDFGIKLKNAILQIHPLWEVRSVQPDYNGARIIG